MRPRATTAILALLATLFLDISATPTASAAPLPEGLHYQGFLAHADGSPVDTTVGITFAAFNVDLGGVPLWTDTIDVIVEQGLFSVELGNPINPFPSGLFDGPVYVGLFVAGEEMLPRRALSNSAYAFKARDADTLDGMDASDLDQSDGVALLMDRVSTTQDTVDGLQTTVTVNDARIDDLEATGADITAVTAGAGLTGGGTAGGVQIGVSSGGIASAMISAGAVSRSKIAADAVDATKLANNSVTSDKVADGSIKPVDMNAQGQYDFAGINVGTLGLEINSERDIVIRDDANALRWKSTDGTIDLGSLAVRPLDLALRQDSINRTLLFSNLLGIGIGTESPQPGYTVTVPSLTATDKIGVGLTRVVTYYIATEDRSSCYIFGGSPCWTGSGQAVCPVGMRVIGGGGSGGSNLSTNTSSHAATDTSWDCKAAGALRYEYRCTAICARLD